MRIKNTFFIVMVLTISTILFACNETNGSEKSGNGSDYPSKSISAISPWPAGSGSDIAFRGYTDYLGSELDQTINVQNISGGNGGVGWAEAAQAKNDGYNISLLTFDVLTNEALGVSTVSYKDFELINMFTVQGMLLITHSDYDYKDLEGFLAAAKKAKEDGKTLTIGTNGDYGIWHQAGALMAKETGTEGAFNFVPMDGSSEQVSELLGKHLDAIIVSPTPAIGHIQSGKLLGLGTLTEERLPALPEIPTFMENGYDVKYESWRAVAVPKGTDESILNVLRDAGKKAFDDPEFQKWANESNIDPYYLDHEQTLEYLEALYPKVEQIIKDFNIN